MEELTGKTTAQVTSAVRLNQHQISALKTVLSKKTGKQVDISLRTDTSLIGGLHIHVDGHVVDSTVKKQLRDILLNA